MVDQNFQVSTFLRYKADLCFNYFVFKCGGFKKYRNIAALYSDIHNYFFNHTKLLDEDVKQKSKQELSALLEQYNTLFKKSREIINTFPETVKKVGELDRSIIEQVLQHALFAGKNSYEVLKDPKKYNVTIQ